MIDTWKSASRNSNRRIVLAIDFFFYVKETTRTLHNNNTIGGVNLNEIAFSVIHTLTELAQESNVYKSECTKLNLFSLLSIVRLSTISRDQLWHVGIKMNVSLDILYF